MQWDVLNQYHGNRDMGLVFKPQHLSQCHHIPGSKNIQADKESRVLKESTEWSLSQEVFNIIQERCGKFDIDLFASRLIITLRSLNMSHGDLTLGHSLLMLFS